MRFVKSTVLISSLLVLLPVCAGAIGLKSLSFKPGRCRSTIAARKIYEGHVVSAPGFTAAFREMGKSAKPVKTSPLYGMKKRAQHKLYEWSKNHLPKGQLERLLEREIVAQPLPGEYISFPGSWEHFSHAGGKPGSLAVTLQGMYGEDALLDGDFLSTFEDVMKWAQTRRAENLGNAAQAVEKAYLEGLKKDSGFFALYVQGTEQYQSDVLLLELHQPKAVQFISLRASLGDAAMEKIVPPQVLPTNANNTTTPAGSTQTPAQRAQMRELKKVDVYFAMRRIGQPLELPATYTYTVPSKTDPAITETLTRLNFPDGWGKEDFIQQGTLWRAGNPFKAGLGPYLEDVLGPHLPRLFNYLSIPKRRIIMFNTPGLVDLLPPCTAQQYEAAVANWIEIKGKEPLAHVASAIERNAKVRYETDEFTKKLSAQEEAEQLFRQVLENQDDNYQFLFYSKNHEQVPFSELSLGRQEEILMWVWRNYRLTPQKALPLFAY